MERSPAEPSDTFTIDETVRVYERWFNAAPRGLAMLVYEGEAARREFLNKLAGRVKGLRFVNLSGVKDAPAATDLMAVSLEASDAVVFFGFEEAVTPTPDNARLFNYNRERLASFGARQLWVIGPVWRRMLLLEAFDIYSWFLPNNTISVAEPDLAPTEPRSLEKTAVGPGPSQAARRSAKSLLDRFERTIEGGGEVAWELLNGALEALRSAGAYPETYDLLGRAQDLLAKSRSSGRNESPQGMRDLSVSLDHVGDVQQYLGRRDEALESYLESLGIGRRRLDAYGESPQALRDLSVSLDRVGDVQRDLGRRDEALASYQESLGIRRRLLDAYGESPQALRDLSVSLDGVGDVQRDLGRRDEALASYQESLAKRRRLLDAYGESPQALRDLAISGGRLTAVSGVNTSNGRQALTEATQAIERAIENYGEFPDLLEVRTWLQGIDKNASS